MQERDSMLIAKPPRIRKINDYSYEYTSPQQILSSFTNLSELSDRYQPLAPVRRNLGMGTLLFELGDKLFFDNGETTEGMMVRLQTA